MTTMQIKENIWSVGSIDWDRRLFDCLIPLPHGTSYNSFLVKGSEKTVLIDTVYAPKLDELVSNLKKLEISKIDYIVTNHSEQDHSGSLPAILELYPDATVLASSKGKELLIEGLLIDENKIIAVDDSTQISLGDKTLTFKISPWVHWPDTMFTYIPEDKIIFTCDFLGSHLATSDLYAIEEGLVYESAKRYYAEIMMPFRAQVKKYTQKLREMDLEIIAPSHGPLYNKPEFILEAYSDWAGDTTKNEVVIPYVSMYENTGKMVKYLSDKLIEKGIKVTLFNLPETDIGELAMALVDAKTVIFGAPMVLAGPHPTAVYSAILANALRPKTQYVSFLGSYGWAVQLGEKMGEQFKALLSGLKAETLTPVFTKGLPTEETYIKLDKLVAEICEKHQLSKETAAAKG